MNSKKLYVGGLPYAISDGQLEEIFSAHGTVESARVITDRMTGRSKGFGFVEMSTQEEAEAAMEKLNGTDLEGRTITRADSTVPCAEKSSSSCPSEIA